MGTRLHLGLASVALVAAVGGCGRAGQPADQSSPDTTMINASAALVDTSAATSDVLGDSTDTCSAAAAGKRAIRWVRPGSAVTQDMQPGRLNVIVVENGRIGSLRCG